MQESRLFKILYYVLEKRKVTASELADKFEVSVRTIYRDIDVLSEAGIPIYTAQGKSGGISILENYVLDKSILSQSEQEQILLALQGLDDTNAHYLLSKLGSLFKSTAADWIEVDCTTWKRGKTQNNLFNLIKNAILEKREVSFQYYSSKGVGTNRIVEPLKIVSKGNNWYLYGFCKLRNDFRFFKLSRILRKLFQLNCYLMLHCLLG